jgi:hypothetical protein
LGCVVASARRLAVAVAPTTLEPRVLADALSELDAHNWTRFRDAIIARGLPWESELFAAFAKGSEAERDAGVSEQLLELDWRCQRLVRVPRVCASVSTSAGFLFASVTVMQALASPEPDSAGALWSALSTVSLGIAGTSFCAAVHFRARRVIRERLASLDRLVMRLRVLARGEQ